MAKFENVTVIKEANIYYDGKVTSRTVEFQDGSVKSLGIMLEGEYTFNTADKEIMEILSGDVSIKLPGEEWKTLNVPESFEVEANASFDIKINSVTDYCCSYIKES
ncbi:pyrimidine/purine nucleoside phosphorylase [Sulfurimonas sp.]|uniref:pyrimidine/purine nucleoside phosphorylase n=1 Tax=Sulfurimonas sp. TaxID=2022749 RepID=UPI0026109870|nr:pyrimidine/purine nucleoside phosphorylase [Sulfurimonas sp.]